MEFSWREKRILNLLMKNSWVGFLLMIVFCGVLQFWFHNTYTLVTLLVVILVVSLMLAAKVYAQLRGKQMILNLHSSGRDTLSQQLEINLLTEKMKDAVNKLQVRHLSMNYKKSEAMYVLPWYLIIGAPASGKTSLLRNSGIRFIQADDDAIELRGISGTRNCDWWISNQGIFLDTAGRYTRDDSDKQEWLAFLKTLKKYRHKMPINGVLITLTLQELLCEDNHPHHIGIILRRVNEITQLLGYDYPVHLVITKCDQLTGFCEFFNSYSMDESKQLFGISLTDGKGKSKNLQQGYLNLLNNLEQQQIRRLSFKASTQEKLLLCQFTESLTGMGRVLIDFVSKLERASGEKFNLISCQLTSAMQPHHSLEITQQAIHSVGRSYFVYDIFNKLLNNNQHLFYFSWQKKLTNQTKKFLWLGCLLIIMSTSVLAFGHSYNKLSQALISVYSSSTGIISHFNTQEKSSPAIQQVSAYHQALNQLKQQSAFHWYQPWTYSTHSVVTVSDNILTISLHRLFDQSLITKVNDNIKLLTAKVQQDESVRGEYINNLLLHHELANPTEINVKQLTPMVSDLLAKGGEQEALIENYLMQLKQDSQPLIKAKSYDNLTRTDDLDAMAQDIYSSLADFANQQLPPLALSDLLIANNSRYLKSDEKISSFYTSKSYEQYLKPLLSKLAKENFESYQFLFDKESRLTEQQSAQLSEEITKLYLASRQQAWREFVGSVRVVNTPDLKSQISFISQQQTQNSAIVNLVQTLLTNNDVQAVGIAKDYRNILKQWQAKLEAINESGESDKVAFNEVKKTFSGDTSELRKWVENIYQLSNQNVDPNFSASINYLLLLPLRSGWQQLLEQTRNYLQTNWQQKVFIDYYSNLADKFPFSKSQKTVNESDFLRFFNGDTSLLPKFYHEYLEGLMNQDSSSFQNKSWLGQSLNFSSVFLKDLYDSMKFTQQFSRGAAYGRWIGFEIYPVAQGNVVKKSFFHDGQRLSYTNGEQFWEPFKWGEAIGESHTVLSVQTVDGQHLVMSSSGYWGLFLLLDEAKVTQSGEDYWVTWSIPNRLGKTVKVSFKLRTEAPWVFSMLLNHQYQLPENIFSEAL